MRTSSNHSDKDRAAPAASSRSATTATSSDEESWIPVEGDAGDRHPSSHGPSPEQALRKECGFSQSLVDDLKAHRHQITRSYLAGNFEVAFHLALYALCTDLFDRFRSQANPLELRATEAAPRSSLNDLSGTPADRLIESQGSVITLDWLQLPPAAGFAALAALPPEGGACSPDALPPASSRSWRSRIAPTR